MRVSDAFPSNWLKAADLQGHPVPLKIEKQEMADVGTPDKPQEKPVLYFVGKQKGLVLNKSNAGTIAAIHGEEMNDWPGKEITIYPTKTSFKGEMVDCIRVQMPTPEVAADPDMPF